MKRTKTLRAVAMICAGIICLNGYAAAAENAPAAGKDAGAGYTAAVQEGVENGSTGNINTIMKYVPATAVLAYVAAPWGTVPAALAAYTGLGMIGNALLPEKNGRPVNIRVTDLAANDRN